MLRLLVFFTCIFSCAGLHAQRVEAEAVLDRTNFRIGEQVNLKLAVHYMEGSQKSVVTWPEVSDTLVKGVEIVKDDSIHTKLVNRASVLYEQAKTLVITAFDSGNYTIPALRFIVDRDTVMTDPVAFYVATVPVDTTKPIRDIKDIYSDIPDAPPVNEGKSSSPWIWIVSGLLSLLLIAGVIYFATRKKTAPVPLQPARHLFPHEKVLEMLAELGRRKPWLHGELKPYHVALTEIMRGWLVERFGIHAREMTTAEIIRVLSAMRNDPGNIMKLERVLRTADLVKFAKEIPADEENESSLSLAMSFVQATAAHNEFSNPVSRGVQ
ncbi:MAG TPA: BatD family protein [Bacteroidia bacterium]|nr:BatD family protein [Bacteroidia bacterium]